MTAEWLHITVAAHPNNLFSESTSPIAIALVTVLHHLPLIVLKRFGNFKALFALRNASDALFLPKSSIFCGLGGLEAALAHSVEAEADRKASESRHFQPAIAVYHASFKNLALRAITHSEK